MIEIITRFINNLENITLVKSNSNTQNSSITHSNKVKNILEENGFILVNIEPIYGQSPVGFYYIEQPNGSQQFPDFILYNITPTVNISINLELKSGKGAILWNDGFPKKDSIYLFTDTKKNISKLFTGCIISDDLHEKYKERREMIHEQNKTRKIGDFNFTVRQSIYQKIVDLPNDENVLILLKKFYDYKEIKNIVNEPFPLKAISLFSGAGGDTLGMKNAGIEVVGYIENNKKAIETHNINFPNCKLIGSDITEIEDEEFTKYIGDIDIIFGGFPCQSFSHAGKKKPNDSRGFLYQHFVRIANIIKPKLIIGENVKGILTRITDNGISFIDTIINDFQTIGYKMKYSLFNVKDYGLPQDRQRVLIYGIREDLNINLDLQELSLNILPTFCLRVNKDILEYSLVNALKIEKQNILDLIPIDKFIYSDINEQVSGNPPTNLVKCYNNNEFSFKKRSKSTFSCIIDLEDLSRTIISTYGRMPRLFVPIKNLSGFFLRPYTIKELQSIQGFPSDFVFSGNNIEIITQIGNAIPPLFVFEIMKYIKNVIVPPAHGPICRL